MRKLMLLVLMTVFMTVGYSSVAHANAGDMEHLFRGDCDYTHSNTGDPIAYPTPEAAHMHDFIGNDTTDQNSTVESLQADSPYKGETNQLQCDRAANKSSYWAPRISWGGVDAIPHRSGIYYATRTGLNPGNTDIIPFGFKMIARSPAQVAAGLAPAGSQGKIYFHCNAQKSAHEAQDRSMRTPPTECPIDPNYGVPTMGITIKFPECWTRGSFNQVGGASMRHSFVNSAGDRKCPSTHPFHIPQLTMLLDYKLPQRQGPLKVQGHGGEYVDYRNMHADYFNSEDLRDLIVDCIRQGNGQTNRCNH